MRFVLKTVYNDYVRSNKASHIKERMTMFENLNLIETTTLLQSKNGTREFRDTITGRSYASYKSGYVRRIIYTHNKIRNKTYIDMYFLNKRYNNSNKAMLVSNEHERLELIYRHIKNTRNKMK
jgi:hypothetical protein